MEGETSWVSHYFDNLSNTALQLDDSYQDHSDEADKESESISLEILPDDLLERILAYLPIASIFRAGSVCKRWQDIVSSKSFLWNHSRSSHQKPWYFMFTGSNEPSGYAYDPILRKWYALDLPRIETSNWFIASSYGLVCFMDNEGPSRLYICNPITKSCIAIGESPGPRFCDYTALSVSIDPKSHDYSIVIVKSKQVPRDFLQWDLSVHIYGSEMAAWTTVRSEVLPGWRAGDESVICDGVLYFLIYSAAPGRAANDRHGLMTCDLRRRVPPHRPLMSTVIPVPCSLTCGRLMNLREKLIMVGGIGKPDRPDIIKGIGIWALKGREWLEIARVPHKYFQGFGELDDVFASSGTDELIYIQSYGAPALLIYDIGLKQWKWAQKSPVTKKFPLQLFTGFCFEPRLEIDP